MKDSSHNTDKRIRKEHPGLRYNHPLRWMVYLVIGGISLLFLVLLVAFTFTAPDAEVFNAYQFPEAFTVSTFVLLISGFLISRAEDCFREDLLIRLRLYLSATLLLGLFFTITQVIGWQQLTDTGIRLSGHAAGAYLYLISGLHLAHLAGGIVFLLHVLLIIHRASGDEIRSLVLVTDPYQKVKLEVLVRYWIFMDILWTVLFFYFLFWF